ncbi:MAG TPA: hypothetical protein PLN78_07650 [Pseudomonadales bacterium]|nr:hypothetical protein [Pseudomonadales bacterium]
MRVVMAATRTRAPPISRSGHSEALARVMALFAIVLHDALLGRIAQRLDNAVPSQKASSLRGTWLWSLASAKKLRWSSPRMAPMRRMRWIARLAGMRALL